MPFQEGDLSGVGPGGGGSSAPPPPPSPYLFPPLLEPASFEPLPTLDGVVVGFGGFGVGRQNRTTSTTTSMTTTLTTTTLTTTEATAIVDPFFTDSDLSGLLRAVGEEEEEEEGRIVGGGGVGVGEGGFGGFDDRSDDPVFDGDGWYSYRRDSDLAGFDGTRLGREESSSNQYAERSSFRLFFITIIIYYYNNIHFCVILFYFLCRFLCCLHCCSLYLFRWFIILFPHYQSRLAIHQPGNDGLEDRGV